MVKRSRTHNKKYKLINMKPRILIFALVFIVAQIKAQFKSYSSGKVYIEMMNTKTNTPRNTQYYGSITNIFDRNNGDIDIEFVDREGSSQLIFLKNVPDMASSSFQYMIDVNSKSKEEFFVANLIDQRGLLILLSAKFKKDETFRMQIIDIKSILS